MKTALKAFLLVAVLGYLVFAVVTMSHSSRDNICTGVSIVIRDTTGHPYMTEEYISDIFANRKLSPEGQKLSEINLQKIEREIRRNAYVDSVLCYYTPSGELCVSITPRTPVMHVMTSGGENYYMDKDGHTMPTADFNLDLCLVTGRFTKQYAKTRLVPLADFINTHSPWNTDIQQVNVVDPNRIELISEVGDNTIVLGTPDYIEDKFNRLSIFYHEGLDKAGWNKYKEINLSFKNQVVCTKRD